MLKYAAAVLLILLPISDANAGFYDGNEIFAYCSNNRAFVNGYVAGSFDKAENDSGAFFGYVIDETSRQTGKDGFDSDSFVKHSSEISQYCSPSSATLFQTTDVFCQFLVQNPSIRHLPAAQLFNRALANAWPCKAASKTK